MILAEDSQIETHVGILDKESIRLVTPLLRQNGSISEAYFLGDNSQKPTFERIKMVLSTRNVECFFYEITPEPDPHTLIKNIKSFCHELEKKNVTCFSMLVVE